jgi:hypothetical protein
MRGLRHGLLAMALLAVLMPAAAADYGTADQAKNLVAEAARFYHIYGRDKLVAEVNDPHGRFVDRDLYVVVYALDGTRLAHPYNKDFIGTSVAEAVDFDGKHYGIEELEVIGTKGRGWVDYIYTDPLTRELTDKSFYVEKIDDSIFLGCGIYRH